MSGKNDEFENKPIDFIYGKNPVSEALSTNPKRINKVMIANNIGLDNRLKKIKELALLNKINLQFSPKEKFEPSYQGVIAYISPIEYADFEEFLGQKSEKYRKLVILDGISDPHNFGAIIRTCVCAGIDGIIIPNHRSITVNSTVEKVSSGAVNHIKIFKVNSLSSTLDRLKDNDWWIIATSSRAKDNYFAIDYCNMNFALVLGSEGSGISKTLENKADFMIKIPSKFESLNVSNACAVIVYEAFRQSEVNNL